MALYVFDSSVWMKIHKETPPDIYVSLWQRLSDEIESGMIRSPDEVCIECERGTDGLAKHLKAYDDLFVPLEEDLQLTTAEVIAACPGLSDPDSTKNHADPFVVGLAKLRAGAVVSQENRRKSVTGPMKIPDACEYYGLSHMRWFDFLREVGWTL